MLRFNMLPALVLALSLIAWCGCNSTGGGGTTPPAGQSSADSHDHAGEAAAQDHGSEATAKVKEALAKLSPEDAAAAEKQHACPVSGAMLGSMGPPPKVDVNGTAVFICCDGCREELLANADKYLAKLKDGATP